MTTSELYRIVDSFLAESKDQYGNERSLERLNTDRHLAVEALCKVMERTFEEGVKAERERIELLACKVDARKLGATGNEIRALNQKEV